MPRILVALAVATAMALPDVGRAAEDPPATPTPSPAPAAASAPAADPTPTPTPTPEAPSAVAPARVPANRLVLGNLAVLRYNPLGLETQIRTGYQRRLFESSSPVSRDNFVFAGLLPKLNPAYAKIGPAVEVQPLSIFNLRLGAEYVRFFDTFGFLQSFPTPRVDYSDSKLDEYEEELEASYAASGTHVFVEPTFQIKLGSIVVRNKFAAEYWDMDLRDGDTVFYDATLDTLVPDEGMNIANDFDLLYATGFGLTAGIRHSFVRPIYEKEHFLDGEETGFIENRHHRAGMLLAYTFYDRGYTSFNKPTVLLISSWYLSHRWRAGEDVSQGVPYVVLGFAFTSDLL